MQPNSTPHTYSHLFHQITVVVLHSAHADVQEGAPGRGSDGGLGGEGEMIGRGACTSGFDGDLKGDGGQHGAACKNKELGRRQVKRGSACAGSELQGKAVPTPASQPASHQEDATRQWDAPCSHRDSPMLPPLHALTGHPA